MFRDMADLRPRLILEVRNPLWPMLHASIAFLKAEYTTPKMLRNCSRPDPLEFACQQESIVRLNFR